MNSKALFENPFAPLLQYWKIVVRYRWWIFLCTVALGLGGISAIAVMQDWYQATTTILVDPQKVPERYVSSTVVADPAQRLNTISQEVLSTTRLKQIISKYDLYPQMKKGPSEDAIVLMRKDVTIDVKQGSGSVASFSITYKNVNRNVVAPVANELAAGFISWNVESRDQQVTGTTQFLKAELERARQNLKEQESRLGEFKLQHAGEMPDQQVANMQILGHLQSQLEANRDALNRLDVQRTLALRSSASDGAAATPSISAEPAGERSQLLAQKRELERRLLELRKRYTAEFPDIVSASKELDRVKAQLRDLPPEKSAPEVGKTLPSSDNFQVSLLDRDIKRLNDEQKKIVDKIRVYQARIEAAPIREQQALDLSRNYQVSNNNYAALLDKTYNSELAGELEKRQKGERFTILDPATTPERPFKPNRRMLMMVAIFGALCFSVVTAIAKELLSGTVKDENQLAALLAGQIPLLVTIPVVETATSLRRRKLLAFAGIAVALLACGLEIVFLLRVKPIL